MLTHELSLVTIRVARLERTTDETRCEIQNGHLSCLHKYDREASKLRHSHDYCCSPTKADTARFFLACQSSIHQLHLMCLDLQSKEA